MDFSPSRLRQSHEQIIKAERFPFHYSVPPPPSFPIGLGSLDGSFFLKIRQTQAPDVDDDENELVPDQITNEAATQPYLEQPQTLTNNARCRDFFVYLFLLRVKREPECNQRQCGERIRVEKGATGCPVQHTSTKLTAAKEFRNRAKYKTHPSFVSILDNQIKHR